MTLPTRRPPSPEVVLGLYVVGVFLAAALGAPWLHSTVRTLAGHVPAFAPLAAHPMHRYLQRLLLVFAIVALPTLLRALGLRGWRAVGLDRPRAHVRTLLTSAALGAGLVLAAAALPIAAGARVLDPAVTLQRVGLRVLTAVVVAPVVALLEEFLFRGVIDGGIRRARGPGAALAASSAFYAAVHFLARPPVPTSTTWASGLVALGGMLAGLGDLDAIVPAVFTLGLVGAYLGALYQRMGTLFANVGVHAGGIFVLQLYGLITTAAPGADARAWGTGRLVDGWSALAVLAVGGAVGQLVRARRARKPAGAPTDVAGAQAA